MKAARGGTEMADGTRGAGDILFSGTYTNGITLNNPAAQNPATIAASGLVTNSGAALYGGPETAWTVANYGTVTGSGTSGAGIIFKSGGLVENGATGLIVGYRSVRSLNGAEIIGNGIEIAGPRLPPAPARLSTTEPSRARFRSAFPTATTATQPASATWSIPARSREGLAVF